MRVRIQRALTLLSSDVLTYADLSNPQSEVHLWLISGIWFANQSVWGTATGTEHGALREFHNAREGTYRKVRF